MQDIHPIFSVIDTPLVSHNQLLFLVFLLFLLLSTLLGFILYRFLIQRIKKKSSEQILQASIVEDSDIDHRAIALECLENAKKKIVKKEYKEFLLEVTEILKTYLTKTKKTNFEDMTSKEIRDSQILTKTLQKELFLLFTEIDGAKFSGVETKGAVCKKLYVKAVLFLEKF